MSDQVILALIIALVVLAALVIFRRQLSRLFFKAGRDGIEAELEVRQPGPAAGGEAGAPPASAGGGPGVRISGNTQLGRGNTIDVGRDDVVVEDNRQVGEGQEITVRPDRPASGPKS